MPAPSEMPSNSEELVTKPELHESSDASLVLAVARYHQDALAEIYRRHGGAVYALAKRVTRDDQLAEEVTQELFVRLWKIKN